MNVRCAELAAHALEVILSRAREYQLVTHRPEMRHIEVPFYDVPPAPTEAARALAASIMHNHVARFAILPESYDSAVVTDREAGISLRCTLEVGPTGREVFSLQYLGCL